MGDQKRRVVWKFALDVRADHTSINVSAGARVRLAAIDPGTRLPTIWIETDPDAAFVERRFAIYATGQPIDGDSGYPSDTHVGSLIDGGFVWHIYERRVR